MNYAALIFALIIGVAAIWFSLRFIRLYFRVKNWHRVQATIISKEIFVHPKHSTSRSPYGIKAAYEYHFNNQLYQGHMIYLAELLNGQVNHMKKSAENKLESIDDSMKIYVNPLNPSQAVIFCDGIGLYFFVLGMGFFSLLLALTMIE